MSAEFFASNEWLKKYKIKPNDARRLANALCTLVDFEDKITTALSEESLSQSSIGEVCQAIRHLVDGDEKRYEKE